MFCRIAAQIVQMLTGGLHNFLKIKSWASGGMADAGDLKSPEAKPRAGSNPASPILSDLYVFSLDGFEGYVR